MSRAASFLNITLSDRRDLHYLANFPLRKSFVSHVRVELDVFIKAVRYD